MHSNGPAPKHIKNDNGNGPISIKGGGFVGQSPEHHASQAQGHVYNTSYQGASYAVKYLGIVDGTMGILSRKMAML